MQESSAWWLDSRIPFHKRMIDEATQTRDTSQPSAEAIDLEINAISKGTISKPMKQSQREAGLWYSIPARDTIKSSNIPKAKTAQNIDEKPTISKPIKRKSCETQPKYSDITTQESSLFDIIKEFNSSAFKQCLDLTGLDENSNKHLQS